MKKRLFSWGLLGMSLALPSLVFDLPRFLPVVMAQDSDSSCPAPFVANPGGVNNWGPCTDPHTYNGVGIGNGQCGRCGNVTWTYAGGICTANPACGPFNCLQTSYPGTITDAYVSTPVTGAAFAACVAATTALFIATAGLTALCGAACIVSGAFHLGAGCLACLTAAGAAGTAIACYYNECSENCNCTLPASRTFGPLVNACW